MALIIKKSISEFAAKFELNGISECLSETKTIEERLSKLYDKVGLPPDMDMIVFGSIARKECTCGSDIDWTLLDDIFIRNNIKSKAGIVSRL